MPEEDSDLGVPDPAKEKALESLELEKYKSLCEFADDFELTPVEALDGVLRDYLGTPLQEGDAPSQKVEPEAGTRLATAAFLFLMFAFWGVFWFLLAYFFHRLNGLRIPDDAWVRFVPRGAEHLMFIAPFVPALILAGWVAQFVVEKIFGPKGKEEIPLRLFIISSLICFPFALYGAFGYGWVDDEGVHVSPLYGVPLGTIVDYDWDEITHVHTVLHAKDGSEIDTEIEFRVIFYDGRTFDLTEYVRNNFFDSSESVLEKLKEVDSIRYTQDIDLEAAERLGDRKEKILSALDVTGELPDS